MSVGLWIGVGIAVLAGVGGVFYALRSENRTKP
jgi:hypothetical protein